MNLGFSEKWPNNMPAVYVGKPTYFIEKIWQSAFENHLVERIDYTEYDQAYKAKFGGAWDWRQDWDMKSNQPRPKLHTIREGNRWKAGDKIHFVINSRSKDRFQFAPVLQVVGVQKFEIEYLNSKNAQNPNGRYCVLRIDGESRPFEIIQELVINDGFECFGDFLTWFNTDFTGQIIHWTALRY